MENDYVRYWFEDGILFYEFKKPTHISLQMAIEIVELRYLISKGQFQYLCINANNIVSVDKKATAYVSKYGEDFLFARAILIDSKMATYMYNSYKKIKEVKNPYWSFFYEKILGRKRKTEFPYKAFSSKEEAVNWLKNIKNKNEMLLN